MNSTFKQDDTQRETPATINNINNNGNNTTGFQSEGETGDSDGDDEGEHSVVKHYCSEKRKQLLLRVEEITK